ncbi:MAG: cyclic nucleotide-binding domain-containing protein [Proteobacteria bacterium]|nr:cyclic nucleotide-binding domain-containing protein [Pseudomonadota bacterium]MCG2829842.1 cyclic nucleotide-binding domain-containing protein [Desulfobacteraceae bacterium]
MVEESMSKAIIDFFVNIPIFDRINGEELRVVAKHMNIVELDDGQTLFNESDKGNYICFIVEGALEVIKKSKSGSEVLIATLYRGQSIGEMSVIDDYPRSATARAKEKTTLYILSKSAFDMILERHSKIGIKLLKGIARLLSYNLRKTSNRLTEYIAPLS